MRPPDLTAEKPLKSRLAPQHALLLVIDIEDIDLTRALCKLCAPCPQEPSQHRRPKRIEEKGDARPIRQRELRGIAAKHADGGTCSPGCAPPRHVPAADARKGGVKLDSNDGPKWIFAGQHHGAAHAGAHVNKGVCIDWRLRAGAAPAHNDSSKHRGSHGIISRDMAIVPVAGDQVPTRNQPAGPDPKLQIERMTNQPILFRQPRQGARP